MSAVEQALGPVKFVSFSSPSGFCVATEGSPTCLELAHDADGETKKAVVNGLPLSPAALNPELLW